MTTAADWKYMSETLGEIKNTLTDIQKRMQALELREAGCSPLMTSKLDAAFRKLDEHETKLKNLPRMEVTAAIAAWVAGLCAASVITYLITRLLP